MMPKCVLELGNIGSVSGMLSDNTKPLPEPMLTYCELEKMHKGYITKLLLFF